MKEIDKYKEIAANKAVESIKDGMIVGLGSGSTAEFAIRKIAQLYKAGSLENISGVPSSIRTEKMSRELGIPLTDFSKISEIDLTIDGADEVDHQLNLIKGGGGALLREKILIQASKRVIIIIDESKLSKNLGTKWPLPIEVLPFAWQNEANYLKNLGAKIELRHLLKTKIYVTDQKNYIIDADFGSIPEPGVLNQRLNMRAGIIEHGLFVDLASEIIIGGKEGVTYLR
jgi:ribose 5-phosphate isomerase A